VNHVAHFATEEETPSIALLAGRREYCTSPRFLCNGPIRIQPTAFADLTDPQSIPQELTWIVPRLSSVDVRPLLLGSRKEWGMFSDLV
jgi:hypothetical protein